MVGRRRGPVGRRALATSATLLSLLAGCSGGPEAGGGAPDASPAAPADLRGVCPETIVAQGSWWPSTAEPGMYSLLGPDVDIDSGQKRVSGPLMARGQDTGVRLELRAGGPAIGFTPVPAQMYLDQSITIGILDSFDELLQLSAGQPTLAFMAPFELDPQMIMWDPETYPEFETIRDIGESGTKVLYVDGDVYMEYLIGSGILDRDQLDGSYDGSPSRFVAERGEYAQSGFATHDPYIYESVVKEWGKPVRYQLVYETGYPNYGPVLAIRTADREALAPCLDKLTPIIQQGLVDMMANPGPTIALTSRLNDEYRASTAITRENEEWAVPHMRQLGLVGNGGDSTVGNFDEARVQRMIDITGPIFSARGTPLPQGLKPSDVVTNEFIDPAIGFAD